MHFPYDVLVVFTSLVFWLCFFRCSDLMVKVKLVLVALVLFSFCYGGKMDNSFRSLALRVFERCVVFFCMFLFFFCLFFRVSGVCFFI